MAEHTPIIIKKKKVHADHGHHGGSWKVAYADFVTAMMAFFMVMWILGMTQENRSMISGYFNDPFGFKDNQAKNKPAITPPGRPETRQGAATSDGNAALKVAANRAKKIEKQIKESLDQVAQKAASNVRLLIEGVEITVTREGLRIEFVERRPAVFFDVGKATIRPEAKPVIDRVARVLSRAGLSMTVDGHTDARPYPSAVYDNWDLSTDRANAMRRELKFAGVSVKQFLSVRGLADTKLRRPDQPLHESNRRVSLFLPFQTEAEGLPRTKLRAEIDGTFEQPVSVAPDGAAGPLVGGARK